MPIIKCVPCKPHPFQDKMYAGKRVYTWGGDKLLTKSKKRCTVCGNTIQPTLVRVKKDDLAEDETETTIKTSKVKKPKKNSDGPKGRKK